MLTWVYRGMNRNKQRKKQGPGEGEGAEERGERLLAVAQ